MKGGPDFPEVAALLAGRIEDLTRDLVGEPSQRRRQEWRFRSKGSLQVWVAGLDRGRWRDYEAVKGGDALALVAHLHNLPMHDARRWALEWLCISGSQPTPRPAPIVLRAKTRPSDTWSIEMAQKIWREAAPASGTLVEVYLASRGVSHPAQAPIRFHPRAWRNSDYGPPGPAMVALMTDPVTGAPTGTHVTYLRADGSGKADGDRKKIMLGGTGTIRLFPDEEVTMGLGLSEGIENALSVVEPPFSFRPVWAAGSAGALAKFPVLTGIEALTIFRDPGATGSGAAQECATRWTHAGREVWIAASPRGDFNDLVLGRAA